MNLENTIRLYLIEKHMPGEDPSSLQLDDELVNSGILDSLALIQVIAHLESAYQIKIDRGEILLENFNSTRRLAAFVSRKQNQKQCTHIFS